LPLSLQAVPLAHKRVQMPCHGTDDAPIDEEYSIVRAACVLFAIACVSIAISGALRAGSPKPGSQMARRAISSHSALIRRLNFVAQASVRQRAELILADKQRVQFERGKHQLRSGPVPLHFHRVSIRLPVERSWSGLSEMQRDSVDRDRLFTQRNVCRG